MKDLTGIHRHTIMGKVGRSEEMQMRRISMFLRESQLAKLQVLSKKTGAPQSELIRRAIDKYLAEEVRDGCEIESNGCSVR